MIVDLRTIGRPYLRGVYNPPLPVNMQFPVESLEATLRHPLTLTNEGNATASFAWTTRGAFNVSPEKGTIGPKGAQDAEVVWTPQPGCKTSETLVLKVMVVFVSS